MKTGLAELKKKLAVKQIRVLKRYRFYEMKDEVNMFKSIIPDDYKTMTAALGWCSKAVDSIADRIMFDTFDHDDFEVNEIFRLNNPDVFFDSAALSALISACSFVYISKGQDGYPTLQVIDGYNATGDIDPVTCMLKEGYAVLERDANDNPTLEAYFKPYQTDYYVNGKLDESLRFTHSAPYALLVPIIHRPDAARPFGHSRISRACMEIVHGALRTLIRSEVAAEFYSFPQKYVLGISEDLEFNNRLATYSSFLKFTKDEDNDKPTVGQFQQQSMAPYTEHMRMYASVFAGETGLTLDDLGFSTDNPASSEAIRASHETLRLAARKAQRTFGTGFVNVAYLAACVRDKQEYDRRVFADLQPMWMPIFEPDAAGLGVIGDAILKINQASPDFLGKKNIKQLTGLESDAPN